LKFPLFNYHGCGNNEYDRIYRTVPTLFIVYNISLNPLSTSLAWISTSRPFSPSSGTMSLHFSHRSTNNLTIGRHHAPDLVSFVKANTRRRGAEMDSRQRRTFEKYQEEEIYSTSNRGRYPDGDRIKAYFEFFDIMFFGGALTSVTSAKIFPKPENYDEEPFAISETYVYEDEEQGCHIPISSIIKVFLLDEDYFETKAERCLHYVGHLLREMCNTFLQLYSCIFSDCRHKIENLGLTGYGFAWQDMALAVELACRDREFLRLDIKLDRRRSLAKELIAYDVAPPKSLLGKWGFMESTLFYDEEEIERMDTGLRTRVMYND